MYNYDEQDYLNLMKCTLEEGIQSDDRTGVGTVGLFGPQLRFDLKQSFPLLTTKKIIWPMVTSELLWFIEGSGDERRLAELRYGKPRSELADKNTIWTANANSSYWRNKAKFEGDCGKIYGVMWRHWPTSEREGPFGKPVYIDQLAILISGLKADPYGRRHILTAWNPSELKNMALPPCHLLSQFYVRNGELSCQLYARSIDLFLGCPVNIASYSLLTLMIAQVCGLKPKEFVMTIGDAHIYLSHLDAVNEQLGRVPNQAPTVVLDPTIKNIEDFTMDSFTLNNYNPQATIKAPMAV